MSKIYLRILGLTRKKARVIVEKKRSGETAHMVDVGNTQIISKLRSMGKHNPEAY